MKSRLSLLYGTVIICNFFLISNFANGSVPKKILTKQVTKQVINQVTERQLTTSNENFKEIDLTKISDILPIPSSNEVPRVIYNMNSVSLKGITVSKNKKLFLNVMIPSAMVVIEKMSNIRKNIKLMIDNKIPRDDIYLQKMYKKYNIKEKNITVLYKKLKPVPLDILLAQAIIESGWGKSRFFQQANNIFGVWAVNSNESRIKASGKRGTKNIYVKRYATLEKSIEDYINLLIRSRAYSSFRNRLQTTSDYKLLVPELNEYSELGAKYTRRIMSIIETNQLYKYNNYEFK